MTPVVLDASVAAKWFLRDERTEFAETIFDPAYVALRAHGEEADTHDFATAFPGARLYPMILAGRLSGVLATGERESGETMPPDIDEAIRRIAAAVAIALAAIESDRIRSENTILRQRIEAAV